MGAEARLAELKLTLPPAPKPVATYVTAVRHGDLLYVSGHGPLRPDGTMHTGKVGADLDVAAGQAAARQTGLAILATVRTHLGSLDKVVRLVKVLGHGQLHPRLRRAAQGHQRLLRPDGRGLRRGRQGRPSAVGMVALPGGIAVEIEAIFQVKD